MLRVLMFGCLSRLFAGISVGTDLVVAVVLVPVYFASSCESTARTGVRVNDFFVILDYDRLDTVLVDTFLFHWCFPTQNTLFTTGLSCRSRI